MPSLPQYKLRERMREQMRAPLPEQLFPSEIYLVNVEAATTTAIRAAVMREGPRVRRITTPVNVSVGSELWVRGRLFSVKRARWYEGVGHLPDVAELIATESA